MKRGEVIIVERSTGERREVLLFNDCLVWLARERGAVVGADMVPPDATRTAWDGGDNMVSAGGIGGRPGVVRRRSKSENELPRVKAKTSSPPSSPTSRTKHQSSNRHSLYPGSLFGPMAEEQQPEKWEFKGKVALIDLEVVVLRRVGTEEEGGEEERKLEILSTEGSFVIYAGALLKIYGLCTPR